MSVKKKIGVTASIIALVLIGLWQFLFSKKPNSFEELEQQITVGKIDSTDTDAVVEHALRILYQKLPEHKHLASSHTDAQKEPWNDNKQEAINEVLAHIDGGVVSDSTFFSQKRAQLYRLHIDILDYELYLKKFKSQSLTKDFERVLSFITNQFENLDNDLFPKNQVTFYRNLNDAQIEKKLSLESCYLTQRDFYNNHKLLKALPCLASGIFLADQIGDYRRRIDLLSHLQFILFSDDGFGLTKTSLILGSDLLKHASKHNHRYAMKLILLHRGGAKMVQGNYDGALQEFEKSKLLCEELNYSSAIVERKERIAIVYRRFGFFKKALEYYDTMLDSTATAHLDSELIARVLIGRGLVAFELGNFEEAKEYYEKSLDVLGDNSDSPYNQTALTNLGEVSFEVGDYEDALERFDRAIAKIIDETKSGSQKFSRLSLQTKRAEVNLEINNIDEALQIINAVNDELKITDFDLLRAKNLLLLGTLQNKLKKTQAALQTLEEAHSLFKNMGLVAGEIEALNLIAETHINNNDTENALSTLNEALIAADAIPELAEVWRIHHLLGKAYYGKKDYTNAEQSFEKAIAHLKKIASSVYSHEQRATFSQKIQPVFEDMVLLQIELGHIAKAFDYSEKERAQVASILLREKMAELEPESMVATFAPTTPELNRIELAQNLLDDDMAIIEYELTDSLLVIWVLRKNVELQADSKKVKRDTIANLVQQFRHFMTIEQVNDNFEDSFEKSEILGRQFFKLLIEPIIQHLSGVRQIYFIPDETLHHLPFTAILDGETYLIQQFAIAQMPSTSIFIQSLQKRTGASVKPAQERRLLSIGFDDQNLGVGGEAEPIAKLFEKNLLLMNPHEAPTELNVRARMDDGFDAILFATHGYLNQKQAYFSYLGLQAEAGISEPERDGQLNVLEIQNLSLLSTDLVFLAACESATGRLYRGEGIIGMHRAFLVAGASTVIANIWKVDSKFTERITTYFFEEWQTRKVTKIKALQAAQIKLIEKLKNYDATRTKATSLLLGPGNVKR